MTALVQLKRTNRTRANARVSFFSLSIRQCITSTDLKNIFLSVKVTVKSFQASLSVKVKFSRYRPEQALGDPEG
jgi:hypothetical protein